LLPNEKYPGRHRDAGQHCRRRLGRRGWRGRRRRFANQISGQLTPTASAQPTVEGPVISASFILTPAPNAPPAPSLAALDTFWVVLAILIGTGINEWLKKRKQATGAGPGPTESAPPTAPRPVSTSNWEEELRRLLSGEAPAAKPPPAASP